MSRYEEIAVGDRAELTHTITERDIRHFVELTGDDNRLHVDPGYAKGTVFKKPVAHGMLGASFISTVIGTKLPGDGALWFSQSLEFLLPVRIGDTITVVAEVTKKQDRDRIIELKTDILNQHRQTVTTGAAKVKIVETLEEKKADAASPPPPVALVIGATGGIGRAVCRRLAADGFAVAVHYHKNQQAAEELSESLREGNVSAMTVSADIIDPEETARMVEQVVRRLGGLTVLVNCATARIPTIPFPVLSWQDLKSHLDTTVQGMFNLVKEVVPHFEAQKYGKVIAFTTQAIETPSAGWLHYITAKSALHGFARALAFELAPKGITVNLVSPGMTETELISEIPEKSRLMVAAKAPLRRLARPDDVASAVAYLASAGADYVTGETVRVNGGQVML